MPLCCHPTGPRLHARPAIRLHEAAHDRCVEWMDCGYLSACNGSANLPLGHRPQVRNWHSKCSFPQPPCLQYASRSVCSPCQTVAVARVPAVSGEEAFSFLSFFLCLGGPTVCRQPCSRLLRFVLRHSMRRNESEACPHQVHEKNLARSQSCGT
ncbi:hypothetical protein V8C34DRAFT_239111 [Trichoderma compactum]